MSVNNSNVALTNTLVSSRAVVKGRHIYISPKNKKAEVLRLKVSFWCFRHGLGNFILKEEERIVSMGKRSDGTKSTK